jgi:BirA family transcriptional regulator, biotin operon repressor / biotin---[acetyl-CoA-carboxylase] ligase
MNIIKLDAIGSTNDYLKELCLIKSVENFTVVVAKNQTQGKGQLGAIWKTESGKNLTFSILIANLFDNSNQIFDLNVAVSNAIIEVLESFDIPNLAIKWPNDILSGNTKIGGILIENTFKPDKKIQSVVGIGLNVNQTNFENLPKASSLSIVSNQIFDLEALFEKIVIQIKLNNSLIYEGHSELMWDFYHQRLFKKNIEMEFKTLDDIIFIGKISKVTKTGLLEILFFDNSVKTFSIREIQMIY